METDYYLLHCITGELLAIGVILLRLPRIGTVRVLTSTESGIDCGSISPGGVLGLLGRIGGLVWMELWWLSLILGLGVILLMLLLRCESHQGCLIGLIRMVRVDRHRIRRWLIWVSCHRWSLMKWIVDWGKLLRDIQFGSGW